MTRGRGQAVLRRAPPGVLQPGDDADPEPGVHRTARRRGRHAKAARRRGLRLAGRERRGPGGQGGAGAADVRRPAGHDRQHAGRHAEGRGGRQGRRIAAVREPGGPCLRPRRAAGDRRRARSRTTRSGKRSRRSCTTRRSGRPWRSTPASCARSRRSRRTSRGCSDAETMEADQCAGAGHRRSRWAPARCRPTARRRRSGRSAAARRRSQQGLGGKDCLRRVPQGVRGQVPGHEERPCRRPGRTRATNATCVTAWWPSAS